MQSFIVSIKSAAQPKSDGDFGDFLLLSRIPNDVACLPIMNAYPMCILRAEEGRKRGGNVNTTPQNAKQIYHSRPPTLANSQRQMQVISPQLANSSEE